MRCCCLGRAGKGSWTIGVGAAALACAIGAGAFDDPETARPKQAPAAAQPDISAPQASKKMNPHVLEFKLNRIDGKVQDLAEYRGKVVLLVNVASKCGYTPQYQGLETLYALKKDQGFVVLGFPANDFGKQEPGSNSEIAEFCSAKYHVTFPMFEKITVAGDGAHPLYKRLAAQPTPIGGEPKWNFTKFLVDRNGDVVARFDSKVKPDSPELGKKIDALLAAKPSSPGP